MLKYSIVACVIGYFLDLIIGDPHWLYHPVRLIGKLIEVSEKLLRKIFPKNEKGELTAGVFLVIIVCGVTSAVVW